MGCSHFLPKHLVPRYRQKMVCLHLVYPICNCPHFCSIVPCQTPFWNMSVRGNYGYAKPWPTESYAHRNPLPTWVPEYQVLNSYEHRHRTRTLAWVERVLYSGFASWHEVWTLPETVKNSHFYCERFSHSSRLVQMMASSSSIFSCVRFG